MEIYYTYKAINDLKKFPKNTQKCIAEKMRFYSLEDNPLKFAKKLVNPKEGEFRFRVGEFRVFFDVIKDKIFVLKISKRDKAYD